VGAFVGVGVGYDAVFQGYAAAVAVIALGMGVLGRAGYVPTGG